MNAIEMRNLDDLVPYANNPRKNDHAVDKVAAAIKTFGFRVPVLIKSDGSIIDGHLRYKAARAAGLTEVPCMVADDMTDEQIRAFRISVNKVAELAEWDMDLLKEELEALKMDDFDLELIGYDEHELDDMLSGLDDSRPGQDDVPPAPDDPVSRPGDLWLLGNHRLLCGDSTSEADMQTLMGGGSADMAFTDPPYNVDYKGQAGKIKNDKMRSADFELFIGAAMSRLASVLKDGGPVYVAHADAGDIGVIFRRAFLGAGLKLAAGLVWRKNQFVLGRSDYQWMHEPILYGWKTGARHCWYGGRKKRSVVSLPEDSVCTVISDKEVHVPMGDDVLAVTGDNLQVSVSPGSVISEEKPLRSAEHQTMKPVGLVERFVKNSSRRGEIVLDPFGGSGTTLIASEKTGRHCRMMELDEKFCDVIVKRWQDFTGKEATLYGSGKTFAQVKEERRG